MKCSIRPMSCGAGLVALVGLTVPLGPEVADEQATIMSNRVTDNTGRHPSLGARQRIYVAGNDDIAG
jgi:hypothetical protein